MALRVRLEGPSGCRTQGSMMQGREPVNRYMTEDVRSIEVSAPASEVLRIFTAVSFHHLPVVKEGRLVGMLSSADVHKLWAFLPRNLPRPEDFLNERVHIEQLMRWPPITVTGTQSLDQAAAMMIEHGVHALPVTDAREHLVGIITTTDFMLAALNPERREAGEADDEQRSSGARRELPQLQARIKDLEHVVNCAERYVRAGQDERLHSALLKALDKVRGAEGAGGSLLL